MSENIKNAATESAQNAAGAAEAVTHDMKRTRTGRRRRLYAHVQEAFRVCG